MANPIEIVVGAVGGPVAGTTDWNSASLAGVAGYLQRSGYGTLSYSSYTLLTGGGIHLTDSVFSANEVYFFIPTGISYVSPSSNYTNGFNYAAVLYALINRIGWRNSTISANIGLVDSTNQVSKSSRYFSDFHGMVTADNLKDVQENPQISNADFNAYLDSLQRSVIMRALNGVFSAPEYIEQVLLFERFDRQDLPIVSSGNFVGFYITVGKAFDMAVQIDSVTLKFESDVTFPLYLFKSGKKNPIWSQSVSAVGGDMTVINLADVVLNYIGAATKGTTFYFGYFQSDLGSVRAIRENIIAWNKTLVFGAYPFKSVATGNDFDRNIIGYTDVNFGLNLEMSSFKDWTQIIVKKPNLFDELIGLTMAYVVLEQIIYSVRSNKTERILKEGLTLASLIQDLNGVVPVSDGPPAVEGLSKRIQRELAKVRKAVIGTPEAISMDISCGTQAVTDGPAKAELAFLYQRGNYAG